MSSKMIADQRKLGRRVAATTADRPRNARAMQGVIDRCADVVPEGTTSLTLDEAQYYLGRQLEFEMEAARQRDDAHVQELVNLDAERQERVSPERTVRSSSRATPSRRPSSTTLPLASSGTSRQVLTATTSSGRSTSPSL